MTVPHTSYTADQASPSVLFDSMRHDAKVLAELVLKHLKPKHLNPGQPVYLAATFPDDPELSGVPAVAQIHTCGDAAATLPSERTLYLERALQRIDVLTQHPGIKTSWHWRTEGKPREVGQRGGGVRTHKRLIAIAGLGEPFSEAVALVLAVTYHELTHKEALALTRPKAKAARDRNPFFAVLYILWQNHRGLLTQ